MAIAKIEPTGCGEFHGNVKVRLAFYLEPSDARYNERHYLVPIIPPAGYPGERDVEGRPVDRADYDAWRASLPKKWVLAPFHNHFLYLPPDVTEDIIISKINLHLPNFYAAWLQELDKVNGGMRKGWHTETRTRPIRYDKTDPELYRLRKPQCLKKARLIKALAIEVKSTYKGEVFPSTAIDIGAAATDRDDEKNAGTTYINKENPANDTGTITSVEIYAVSGQDLANCEVATFIDEGSDTFSTRDNETIGAVVGGSKHTSSGLDMDVTTGDYIGTYFTSGKIEDSSFDGGDFWDKAGDQIPCSSVDFGTVISEESLSLYGTGETGVTETSKTAAISIGTAMSATRVLAAPRTASISIGDAVTATKILIAVRTSSITIGEAITAFRDFGKLASITIGIAMSATRAVTWSRTAAIPTGISMSATKILGAIRTSQITIGIAVTATKILGAIRTSPITIGIAMSASRLVTWARTASISIGDAVSATRVLAAQRTSSITTGIAVTAIRIYGRVRTAAITIGIAITVDWWTKVVALTLKVRSLALTLQHRSLALTLPIKSVALTLQHRALALTLRVRSLALTLPWRKTR